MLPLPRFSRFLPFLLLAILLAASAPVRADSACGLLWRVEKGGETNHVFGTIHSEDPRVLDLGEATEAAFREAGVYVMELLPDLGAMSKLVRAMHFQDQRNLRTVLGEDLYRRAVDALSEHGVGEGLALKMKPWAVAVTLSFPRPESGMFLDLMLYSRAVQQGKTTFGLESVEEQLAFFQNLDQSDQIALLEATLANLGELEQATDDLIRAYVERRPERLLELSNHYMDELPESLAARFREKAIIGRNRVMVERLKPHFELGGAFAAVGALHLYGEDGIVNLLREAGYEVSCVR